VEEYERVDRFSGAACALPRDSARMMMNRDELTGLFYGIGPTPHPWATDCPIKFDVWWQFAQPSRHGIDQRIDLILTIHEDHGVADVLQRVAAYDLPRARPAAVGGFVVASLALPDLMRAIVPISNLEGLVWAAKRAGYEDLIDRLLHLHEPVQQATGVVEIVALDDVEDEDEPERSLERDERLEWFVRLLYRVIASCIDDAPSAIRQTADMIFSVQVVSERRRGRDRRLGQIVDRRRRYPVSTVTTNRIASSTVTRSRATIKADAAEQVFTIDCSSIGWAVIDSGIDKDHSAFVDLGTDEGFGEETGGSRVLRAFDFADARRVLADRSASATPGLVDWRMALPFLEIDLSEHPSQRRIPPPLVPYRMPDDSHGTHVAGILGGCWPDVQFRGICPTIKLYDFRVLNQDGRGDEFSVLAALQAIRYINDQAGRLIIAGANLSLSLPHEVATHACGWTPICQEAERLVRSGVVVVAAAGNAGYEGTVRTAGAGYRATSISDPGNADAVITVGSTHRSNPHRHGVSYFSSRGPTADGRSKPDLVAPGEDIDGPVPDDEIMAMHGTSQAAAHVSFAHGAASRAHWSTRTRQGNPLQHRH
jgi:hypothetical protein